MFINKKNRVIERQFIAASAAKKCVEKVVVGKPAEENSAEVKNEVKRQRQNKKAKDVETVENNEELK